MNLSHLSSSLDSNVKIKTADIAQHLKLSKKNTKKSATSRSDMHHPTKQLNKFSLSSCMKLKKPTKKADNNTEQWTFICFVKITGFGNAGRNTTTIFEKYIVQYFTILHV